MDGDDAHMSRRTSNNKIDSDQIDAEFEAMTAAEGSIPSRTGMVIATVVALLLIGFWAWAFFRGPGVPHRDEMVSIEEREKWADYSTDPVTFRADPDIAEASIDDRTAIEFMVNAENLCRQMIVDIADLPSARSTETFAARADAIDDGTDIIKRTLADIGAFPRPSAGEDASISQAWLDDYGIFVDNRRAYADRLRSGDDGPITLSASSSEAVRVTTLLTTFAEVNSMYACIPPGDV